MGSSVHPQAAGRGKALSNLCPASAFLELCGQYTSPENSFLTEICLRKTEDKERKLAFASEVHTDTQHLSHPNQASLQS